MYCVNQVNTPKELTQIRTRTKGSCGIGRAAICVAASAPIPAALSVHAFVLSDIHVMYAFSNPAYDR